MMYSILPKTYLTKYRYTTIVHILKAMSGDEEIEVEIDDDNDDELKTPLEEATDESSSSIQPVGVIEEEIVRIVKNPDRESSVSMSPPLVEEETRMDNNNDDNDENIYIQLKTHSIQISKLSDMVESLQSQLKQLQGRRSGVRRTTAIKRKNIQTKKKGIRKRSKGRTKKK